MIERYFVFDVDRFFRDYTSNIKELDNLKEVLDEQTELRGMDYSTPKSGGLMQSKVEMQLYKKDSLERQIKDYETYFKWWEWIQDKIITQKEFEMLFGSYNGKYAEDFHMSDSQFRIEINLIKTKIKRAVRWK